MEQNQFEEIRKRWKSWKYAIGIFVIIMFLWWFQGGHIIPPLGLKPSPAEVIMVTTANAFKTGVATIFNAILNLFSNLQK